MKKILSVFLLSTLIVSPKLQAHDFKVNGKIDLVSDYVWRGAYQNSGFSVQPTLALSYRNLSLSAWGSQSLTKSDGAQEFDLILNYSIGRFGITLLD